MKRILMFFTALAMLTYSFTAFAEETGKTEQDMTEEARIFANYFEVMDTEKNLDSGVSRAEFATYAVRVLGLEEYRKNDVTYYYDVPADHWAAVSINEMVRLGAFTVGDDKIFRPNDTITVQEAVKAILVLMGYESYAVEKGGYPTGYMKIAYQYDLFKNIATSGNLTNADAADLFLNAVNTDVCQVKLENGITSWQIAEGVGLLDVYRDMHTVTGTVRASNEMSLNTGSAKKGTILIDDVRYDYDGDDRYIGRYVKAYYTGDIEDSPKINFIVSKTNDTDIIEINARDIKEFTSDYELEYYMYGKSSRLTKVKIPRNASFIYNGIAISDNIYDKMNIKDGTITLIKTKNGSGYDVVIIREYETTIVTYTDASKQTVVGELSDGKTYDLSGENYTAKIYDANGNPISFSNISKNCVLTIYETPGEYIEVYVSQKKISGIYKGKRNEGEHQIITIGDNDYEVCEKYVQTVIGKLVSNKEVSCLVDMFGNVVGVDSIANDDAFSYGYYIKRMVGEDDEGEQALYVKMYTELEGVKTYKAADKVKIDGDQTKKVEAITNKLQDSLDKTNEILNQFANKPSKISSRLIRFKLNDLNEIKEIDTPYTGPKESNLDALYIDDAVKELYNAGGREMHTIHVDGIQYITGYKTVYDKNKTIVFNVPPDANIENATNKMFEINGELVDNTDIIAYKTSKEHGTADIIVDAKNVSGKVSSRQSVLISDMLMGIDEDENEAVEWIEGYQGQNAVQYIVSSDATNWNGEHITMGDSGIEKGDIVVFILNAEGKVETYMLAYDCSEDICYNAPAVDEIKDSSGAVIAPARSAKILFTNLVKDSPLDFYDCFYNEGTFTKGFVNSYQDGVMGISFEAGGEEKVAYPITSKTGMVYDKELRRDACYPATASDIVAYQDAGSACSKVVAVHSYAAWDYYYIYK